MGPQASKSYPGRRIVKPTGPRAERAKQEIDDGRRDVAGYVFGAFQPASGAALTATYTGRTIANWVDFLGKVERWIDPDIERAYAVVDNLNTHTNEAAAKWLEAHRFVSFHYTPTHASWVNLIEGFFSILTRQGLQQAVLKS